MKLTFYQKCIDEGRLHLLAEWLPEKNEPLTPWTVTPGSHRQVWWKCSMGHEWTASIANRMSGNGCPVCAGKKVIPGVNDLRTLAPKIAAEWHPEKNGSLTPDQVRPMSNRQICWRCGKGHEWRASVAARVRNSEDCPVCANKTILAGVNDLATTHPGLAKEWHPVKNGTLTPEMVGSGSSRRVWWRCNKGHEWHAGISARSAGGNGCPVCAGKTVNPGENDLATLMPQLAAQWHPTRNGTLTPGEVRPQSNRRVWWQCDKGHEWQAMINARSQSGSGCPYCSNRSVLAGFNDLATVEPKIAAQWAEDLNGSLTPEMVTYGSKKRVWWRCPAGHVWQATVYSRAGTMRSGCPVCAGKRARNRRIN
ncbi:MAG: zinc-ribbon domain-containing protein [Lachnospiraceae bacterium]|nr:zinc-ribbon domain-containing protein [Lachnospiraceae bacterium]